MIPLSSGLNTGRGRRNFWGQTATLSESVRHTSKTGHVGRDLWCAGPVTASTNGSQGYPKTCCIPVAGKAFYFIFYLILLLPLFCLRLSFFIRGGKCLRRNWENEINFKVSWGNDENINKAKIV